MHRKIDDLIEKGRKRVDRIDHIILVALDEQESEYTNCISEIRENIVCLRTLLESNDICLVSSYRPRVDRFRTLPAKPLLTKSIFSPKKVNEEIHFEPLHYVLGSLLRKEEQGYILKLPDPLSSHKDRTLTDVPQIISNTDIQYGNPGKFRSISCLNDKEFWTCGEDNIMRLFNFYGELMKSIQTKTGKMAKGHCSD